MKIDREGWLDQVISIPTKRTCALSVPAPLGIVQHWTASGADDARGNRDSKSLARWIADPRSDAKASWHILIDRDGTIIQSASFLVGTHHVGKSGLVDGFTRDVNRCLLGLELENLGELRPDGEGLCGWPWGARAPHVSGGAGERLVAADGTSRWWHRYTPEQERSFELLVRALVARFGWGPAAFRYGHCDFDSPRKIDPGPLWVPIRERVLGRVFGGAA